MRRAEVIERARECLYAPWHKLGRSPRGLDCQGLLIYAAAPILPLAEIARITYGALPPQGFVQTQMARFADRLLDWSAAAPGDLVLIPQRGHSIHAGILTAVGLRYTVIHVTVLHGCTENDFDRRELSVLYRYRGLED